MLRTFTAAAIALSLIAGPAFAQGNAPASNAAPVTTGQPAKADASKAGPAPVSKTAKTDVRHVKHARHVRHHIRHVKHHTGSKHVKGLKPATEKTRG